MSDYSNHRIDILLRLKKANNDGDFDGVIPWLDIAVDAIDEIERLREGIKIAATWTAAPGTTVAEIRAAFEGRTADQPDAPECRCASYCHLAIGGKFGSEVKCRGLPGVRDAQSVAGMVDSGPSHEGSVPAAVRAPDQPPVVLHREVCEAVAPVAAWLRDADQQSEAL
jgi:hypothetical protein